MSGDVRGTVIAATTITDSGSSGLQIIAATNLFVGASGITYVP